MRAGSRSKTEQTVIFLSCDRHGLEVDCNAVNRIGAFLLSLALAPSSPAPLSIAEAVDEAQLDAHYQPVVSLATGAVYGFEGLVRGRHAGWQSPGELFAAAAEAGLTTQLDLMARRRVVRGFADLVLDGKLFINTLPSSLLDPGVTAYSVAAFLEKLNLRPERLVIEVGESQPMHDLDAIKKSLTVLRSLGFQIAIDDLGEAYASLSLWLELRPDYVKIDKRFVQDVHRDSFKMQFVRAIQQISETTGTKLIAEGIEAEAELIALRDLGISYAQGFFLGRPVAVPPPQVSDEVRAAIGARRIAVWHGERGVPAPSVQVGRLVTPIEPISPRTNNETVLERFSADPALTSIPVVDNGAPVGLIRRTHFMQEFVRPYRHEVYDKRPCTFFMDKDALIVESSMPIAAVSEMLSELDRRHLATGFIIAVDGKYLGMGSGQALVRELTAIQINTARYANPLTMLPGNVPLDEHVVRLLAAEVEFVAAYCDIDQFKPFNDLYGYRKGDEMIRALARTIEQAVDGAGDFVGHVGGDDFIVHLQSADWEARLHKVLEAFAGIRELLLLPEHLQCGTYLAYDRHGEQRSLPVPSLSIGVVRVQPGVYRSSQELSFALAEAKREAKKVSGDALFVDRRRRGT